MDDAGPDSQGARSEAVGFGPPAAWVDFPEVKRADAAQPEQVQGGERALLIDGQLNHLEARRLWLARSVVEVVTPEGLHHAGQVEVVFDPRFERLTMHPVRIHRGEATKEIDPQPLMRVFQREGDLERASFDGRLTAHLTIPDVRVGDVVDVAYTIEGSNPILGGLIDGEWMFDRPRWTGETRVRLLCPEGRRLIVQTWNAPPVSETRLIPGGGIERVWRSRDTPPVAPEPEAPPWARQFATVRVRDEITWPEVADAFRVHYEVKEPLPPQLEDELASIVASTAAPSERATAALRLVQSSLRYHSVSIGDGGYAPRALQTIWETRSGDCKDASKLLAALLTRMGLDACAALVDTVAGEVLDQEPPSRSAFDHCVVRLQLDGRVYWLDPTGPPQSGCLDHLTQAYFGFALPLRPAAELEPMNTPSAEWLTDLVERIEFGPTELWAVTLTVEAVHRSWRADALRAAFRSGAASVRRRYLDYYRNLYGDVEELAPPELADEPAENRLRTIERYRLNAPWDASHGEGRSLFTTRDELFDVLLPAPAPGSRRWPLDLGRPRACRSETILEFQRNIEVKQWTGLFQMDGVTVKSELSGDGPRSRRLSLRRSVRIDRRVVPASDTPTYFRLREEAMSFASLRIGLPSGAGVDRTQPQALSGWFWLWVLAVLLGAAALAPVVF